MGILKELFSLVFGKPHSEAQPHPPAKMVLLVSVSRQNQLELFKENLRSQAIPFEIRNETDLYVPEDELETAKHVLKEGQWEY